MGVLFLYTSTKEGELSNMAKGKYTYWLTEEGLLQLEAWARNGLTDEQIAQNAGISASTLYDWESKYSEISKALKKGKEVVDIHVENALLKRALGYSYIETTKERILNSETGEYELITTKAVEKSIAPDTTAQIFWLKNRKPEVWRDKKNVDVAGSLHSVTASMTDDDLSERIINLRKKLGLPDDKQG